ncbi:MAG: ankyrin repeat domain-containing protein [Verrucomicrobiales bacterium]
MHFGEFIDLVRAGNLEAVVEAAQAEPELPFTYDPEDKNEQERTAMHCAARHGHLEIIKFLVEGGAEVYSNPMNSYPAVFWAAINDQRNGTPQTRSIVDYFLNEIPEKADGTQGLGIMANLAARLGYEDIVRKHIERDPLVVHHRGWIGDTPMHWACHNGHVGIVEILLDAGADIEADEINCYGGKPLQWASERHAEVVKLLLERGAEVDSRNIYEKSRYFGITPLGMNVLMEDDCAAVTRLLLDAGADRSFQFEGKSLVEIAAEKGNSEILKVLESQ